MIFSNFFDSLNESFSAFWTKRDARERRLLSIGSVVVVCSLIYFVGIDPAITSKGKLQKEIPLLRQQAAEMAGLSGQYNQIAGLIAENVDPISREFVDSSLQRRNIKAQTLSVSDSVVRVQANAVSYANVMEWILEMQKVARLSVDEAKVSALPEPGQVNIVLTMRQQRGTN